MKTTYLREKLIIVTLTLIQSVFYYFVIATTKNPTDFLFALALCMMNIVLNILFFLYYVFKKE